METNTTTAASAIRNNARWPVIITSILMAITIGSVGIHELFSKGEPSQDLYLKNWRVTIESKEIHAIAQQNMYILNYGEQMRAYLNNMAVQIALIEKDAQRRKISVSNEEIFNHINTDKTFADESGKFSAEKYDETLSYMYHNYSDSNARRLIFESKVKNEILSDKVRDAVTKDIKPSEQEIVDDFHNKYDTVEYDYVTITANTKTAPEPTPEEIQNYLSENGTNPKFMTEKQIKIKYVFFPYNKYKIDAPTEDELKAYYEKNKTQFLDNEASKDTNKEAKYKDFTSVKAEIIKKVTEENTHQKVRDVTDKIHTDMSNITDNNKEIDLGKSFEAIKPENGELGETSYFSKSAGLKELAEKTGDTSFLRTQALDSVKKKTINRAYLEKGVMFYIPIKSDIKEPIQKSLEECKPEIVSILKDKSALEIAKKTAENLQKKCQESKKWEDNIKALNLTAQNQKVIFHEAAGAHKGITTSILEDKVAVDSFLMVTGNQELAKDFFVVYYKARTAASNELLTKEKENIRSSLESSKKANIWSDYIEKLPSVAGLNLAEEDAPKSKKKK